MDTIWELERLIEKIIDNNIREVPYEGLEINKRNIIEDLMNFIPTIPLGLIDRLNKLKNQQQNYGI